MDPAAITAYIQAGALLVSVGGAAIADVKQMFSSAPAMTDDALNQILDGVAADAAVRAKIAAGDAGDPQEA